MSFKFCLSWELAARSDSAEMDILLMQAKIVMELKVVGIKVGVYLNLLRWVVEATEK